MAIIVNNESSLQGDPTEETIQQALAGMDLASVQDSTTASRYAVSSVDQGNVPTLVGAQIGGNTGTQGGTTVNVIGRDSVQAVTTANLVTINLLNDALAPGNTFLYSTGTTGAKGWNALSGMLHQSANILLTTGADGTVTFTLGGAAAGDLSGSYPNPTVAKVNGTALGVTAATAGEVLLGTGTAIASTPISGDATLSGTGALTLAASGVAAGAYGDATHTATFTVDAKGRLTLAGTSAIAFPVTSVFGRTGAVAATSGDYNTGQVTEGTNLYFTAARVLATVLAGLSTATNAVITAADTVLSALGKLQAQITANDLLAVHLAGTETITGAKTFNAPIIGNDANAIYYRKNNLTSNYNLATSDVGTYLGIFATLTVTINANVFAVFGPSGAEIAGVVRFIQIGTNVVTLSAGAGVTISGPLATTGPNQILEAINISFNGWVTHLYS